MITTAIAYGAETNQPTYQIKPWFALSTLWGQGGLGLQVHNPSRQYGIRYNFVANWLDDFNFTYHEVALSTRADNTTFGIKYRHQLSKDEWTPYVGYFIPIRTKVPMSIYNEAEYRFNSVVKDGDYLRTRNILTVYAPKWVEEAILLKPYVALDAFMDWEEADYEKLRLNVGYFIHMEKATARIYFIPWSDGIEEEEWDDQSSFGATLIYHW
jgi:hypothetical protein